MGVLALLDRFVVSGIIDGLDDERSGNMAVNGGVGIPFEYPSLDPVLLID